MKSKDIFVYKNKLTTKIFGDSSNKKICSLKLARFHLHLYQKNAFFRFFPQNIEFSNNLMLQPWSSKVGDPCCDDEQIFFTFIYTRKWFFSTFTGKHRGFLTICSCHLPARNLKTHISMINWFFFLPLLIPEKGFT